jgi:hypothetical protein
MLHSLEKVILELLQSGEFVVCDLLTLALHRRNGDSAENYLLED